MLDSRLYWIWLQQALGYGNGHLTALLHAFASPEEIYEADKNALRECGMAGAVLGRLCDKETDTARKILESTLQHGDWVLTPADAAYPSLLRGIYAPPAVLYGRGEIPDLSVGPAIAVIGTRSLSRYGSDVTAMMASGLVRGGALIISGGAEGGDAVATAAALECGGRVVTVQACGLDVNYPVVNEALRRRTLQQGGTLLSEYPYGVRVGKGTFHVRNRLMSGMAHGVLVTEAPAGSGTLITARHAREQGRDVFAVPGALNMPNSTGGNELIQHGAKLVRSADEILEEYAPLFPQLRETNRQPKATEKAPVKERSRSSPPAPLSEKAAAVLQVLKAEALPVDEIAAQTALSMPQVLAALTELEMFALAVSEAGQQYRRL